jgi:hypothetical protein
MKEKNQNERGQILILLVMAVVGLLGFTALAIDGGMIYSDRRVIQNAADASSVAGAGAGGETLLKYKVDYKDFDDCSNPKIAEAVGDAYDAAEASVGTNDFPVDENDVVITTNCVSSSMSETNIGYINIRVEITHPTRTAFAHFVYDGQVVNTVEAETKVWPPIPEAVGLGIISLTPECTGTDKGMFINGTITVTVTGGGMWSNSCLNFNGGDKGYVSADNGITYVMPDPDGYPPTNMTVDPEPQHSSDPLNVSIDQPDCGGLDNHHNQNGPGTIAPGYYDRIKVSTGELFMEPGIYCVNGAFEFGGDKLTGDDVTIVLIGDKGFKTAANSRVTLTAPKQDCADTYPNGTYNYEVCPPAVEGLLIYVTKLEGNGNVTKDVSLMGTSYSTFSGSVYDPDGTITIGGDPDTDDPDCTSSDPEKCTIDYGVQLIGSTIKIGGTASVTVNYDDDYIYLNPVQAEVSK